MAIKRYLDNGKWFYEVHVKVRDRLGRQMSRRRRGAVSQVTAQTP